MAKKLILTLLTAGFATFASASAYDDCCYSDPCGSCLDGLYVGADFLYWDFCASGLDYALVFDGDPALATGTINGNYEYIHHGWEPGFRVFAGMDHFFGAWNLYGSYTRITTDDHASVSGIGQFVYPTLVNPSLNGIPEAAVDSILASNSIEYQTFDVLFSYDYECFGPCHILSPYVGIEGVKIDQHTTERVVTLNPALFYNVDWHSDFKGLGLKLGTNYLWDLRCGISVFADAALSLVAGHQSAENEQALTNTILISRTYKDSSCHCLPGAHLAAGLEYVASICGFKAGARVGYEFVSWWNVPVQRRFVETDPLRQGISTPYAGGTLTMHGLFAGLFVGF